MTSRVLVFEAIKHARRRKTTIVITHDLSQITDEDYVYVMKNGRVVEEGFREILTKPTSSPSRPIPICAASRQADIEEVAAEEEDEGKGEFRRMLEKQAQSGGFPVRDDLPDTYETVDRFSLPSSPIPTSSQDATAHLAAAAELVPRPGTAMSMHRQSVFPTVLALAQRCVKHRSVP